MTAAKDAKAAGLPNLKYVYTKANVKRTTFNGWYHSNRQLFDVVVAGVKAIKEKESMKEIRKMFEPDERLACLKFVEAEGDKLKYERVKLPSLKDKGEEK